MAERRMFTKKITDDERFYTLPSSTQLLYFHLSMNADDDGFNNQISLAMFKAHASTTDLETLLDRRFLYQFDNGVIVIKHWRMANALRKDRYNPTVFQEELKQLRLKENGSYTFEEGWLPSGCQVSATDKDSIGKDIKEINKEKLQIGCQLNVNDMSMTSQRGHDTDIDIDIKEIYKEKVDTSNSFDLEDAFNKIYEMYPKKGNMVSARNKFLDKFIGCPQENFKDICRLFWNGIKAYLDDYEKSHNDNFKFVPRLDKFLAEDLEYWVHKARTEKESE